MNHRIALAMALTLAGCPAESGIRHAAEDIAQQIGDAIRELTGKHPSQTRALSDLSCASGQSCGDAGAPHQRCSLRATTWREEFRASYVACVASCEDLQECYADSVKQVPPTVHAESRERCQQAITTCHTVTDACDAFAILTDERLLRQLDACSHAGCGQLHDCQSRRLLPELNDAGTAN